MGTISVDLPEPAICASHWASAGLESGRASSPGNMLAPTVSFMGAVRQNLWATRPAATAMVMSTSTWRYCGSIT